MEPHFHLNEDMVDENAFGGDDEEIQGAEPLPYPQPGEDIPMPDQPGFPIHGGAEGGDQQQVMLTHMLQLVDGLTLTRWWSAMRRVLLLISPLLAAITAHLDKSSRYYRQYRDETSVLEDRDATMDHMTEQLTSIVALISRVRDSVMDAPDINPFWNGVVDLVDHALWQCLFRMNRCVDHCQRNCHNEYMDVDVMLDRLWDQKRESYESRDYLLTIQSSLFTLAEDGRWVAPTFYFDDHVEGESSD